MSARSEIDALLSRPVMSLSSEEARKVFGAIHDGRATLPTLPGDSYSAFWWGVLLGQRIGLTEQSE